MIDQGKKRHRLETFLSIHCYDSFWSWTLRPYIR